VLRWWWVLFAFIVGFAGYEQSASQTKKEIRRLNHEKSTLTTERKALLASQDKLQRQIRSQEDPAFIELTLIRTLGLVPEGQRKIYFHKQGQD